MFTDIINGLSPILEVFAYFVIILLPLIIFIKLLSKVKKEFFDLKSMEFDLDQEMTVLEIRNPKELIKSPAAMEIVLSSFFSAGGEGNWFSKRWLGKARAKYSLEIVSIDGHVRLYIWTRKNLKKLVESSFYSQYPTVEIVEVPDYTQYFSYEKDASGGLIGAEFILDKPDPIPIKTYKHFSLDSKTKAEEIIDPVSFIIENLGNIGIEENFWLQFVIRGQKKDYNKKRSWWKKLLFLKGEEHDWKDFAEEEINKLKDSLVDENEEGIKFQKITTDREKEMIQAIIENVNKPSYWVGIRSIYFAKDNSFDKTNADPLYSLFQPLNSDDFNKIKKEFAPGFDYPWQDPNGTREENIKQTLFKDFRKRKFFGASSKEQRVWFNKKRYQTFIMSTEELATVFHPPSAASATPTFERIDSKKGSAPADLPI